jgi:Tol biopolymer transport system component
VQAREHEAVRWTPAAIATDQYETTPTFTPDGREMFYMQSDPSFRRYRLLWSRCEDGKWSKPQAPSFAASSEGFDADPFIAHDGKRLYFISTRQNRTKEDEDFDIWFVEREPNGGWAAHAQRMPEPVNSEGSELLPRMTAQGQLYFGSDRAGGFGQGDIYVASSASDGAWRVRNVGSPVNTAGFEYEAEVSRDGRTLVVVSNRGERSHLYRFQKRQDEWIESGRIPARDDVFQVGPLLSPTADRLLFAQADGDRSGEIFLIDLSSEVDARWPPRCERGVNRR